MNPRHFMLLAFGLALLDAAPLPAQQPGNVRVTATVGRKRFDTEALPKKGRSTVQEPVERTIYLQLPLAPTPVHWMFSREADLLAGRLVLRISRGTEKQEIVIFEGGKFSPDWEAIGFHAPTGVGETYFAFRTKPGRRIPTSPRDQLELELTAVKDLEGRGPIYDGTLPAGTYKAKGSATALFDDFEPVEAREALKTEKSMNDEHKKRFIQSMKGVYDYSAFMSTWTSEWKITQTKAEGWLTPEKARELLEQVAEREKAAKE